MPFRMNYSMNGW